jgi:deoxyribodipyrimidine photo-lyase
MSTVPAPVSLVWFRDDLRLDDHPALAEAAAAGPVAALFVLDEVNLRPLGGAARWWLHHSLTALCADLAARGVTLILRRGDARRIVPEVAAALRAGLVVWNRRYDDRAIAVDTAVKADLKAAGCAVRSFNGALMVEPWEVQTGSGGPYKVFTPFWRAARQIALVRAPRAAPALMGAKVAAPSDSLADWGLLPVKPDWAGGLRAAWTPGEAGALSRAQAFVAGPLKGYAARRNLPAVAGTSRLSPHLRFGEISPRRVWAMAADRLRDDPALQDDADVLASELGWREFSYGLVHHFPDFPRASWKAEFERFPWADNEPALEAWRRGRTGYPIVDAGMRELWTTGWMHNRVRMIVGSFLVKHLLTDWRAGEAWFWDTLVDADVANNAAGWQWIAGCGADAAPYFRVFNPVAQGEKFDPAGAYVRAYVPELARLPDAILHKPWEGPRMLLEGAGVRLGATYPSPLVDHAKARSRALAAFASLKDEAGDAA